MTDPVRGMTVDPDAAAERAYHGGRYWFCGPGCAESVEAEPDRYALGAATGHRHDH